MMAPQIGPSSPIRSQESREQQLTSQVVCSHQLLESNRENEQLKAKVKDLERSAAAREQNLTGEVSWSHKNAQLKAQIKTLQKELNEVRHHSDQRLETVVSLLHQTLEHSRKVQALESQLASTSKELASSKSREQVLTSEVAWSHLGKQTQQ